MIITTTHKNLLFTSVFQIRNTVFFFFQSVFILFELSLYVKELEPIFFNSFYSKTKTRCKSIYFSLLCLQILNNLEHTLSWGLMSLMSPVLALTTLSKKELEQKCKAHGSPQGLGLL